MATLGRACVPKKFAQSLLSFTNVEAATLKAPNAVDKDGTSVYESLSFFGGEERVGTNDATTAVAGKVPGNRKRLGLGSANQGHAHRKEKIRWGRCAWWWDLLQLVEMKDDVMNEEASRVRGVHCLCSVWGTGSKKNEANENKIE